MYVEKVVRRARKSIVGFLPPLNGGKYFTHRMEKYFTHPKRKKKARVNTKRAGFFSGDYEINTALIRAA